MKALVTGLNGFTGQYLKKELEDNGYEVYPLTGRFGERERERERERDARRTCVTMGMCCLR